MQIHSGAGVRYSLKIDSKLRARTYAVTVPEDKDLNKAGTVFSINVSVTPTGANDYFFYYENTGTTDVFLTDIRLSSSVITKIDICAVSGTPSYSSLTSLTPVNRNLGSSKVLTATISQDTNITGLTNEGRVFFMECNVANQMYHLSTSSNIIITPGTALAMQRTESTGLITALVSIADDQSL